MTALLQVRDLSKHFGGIRAVRDVSFEVQKGEILGIIGSNGAGKSTVIDLISGNQRPNSGAIYFRERNITARRPYVVSRRGIARTFQKLRLYPGMTALENAMVSALVSERKVDRARAVACENLEFVGLTVKRDALAGTLSTGQRKRLELARAMSSRPELYLLDEVMAGVDHQSLGELVELVGSLRKTGATILLIEHNLSVVRRLCDRLVAMHLGETIATGEPESVLNDDAVILSYVGA